ncbi:MAG: hypothetical protein JW909_12620 [Planctomycetes bacterium]|nr:hypothetical protein [Planctomycetota bacterium]
MPREERPIVPEVGQTSPTAGWILAGFFVAAIFAVPLSQLVWELATGAKLQEFNIFKRIPKLSNIQRYEDALSENNAAANALRPFVQWVQLSAVNQGNEEVAVGQDGWLFYKTGLRYVTGPGFRSVYCLEDVAAKSPDPLPAVLDFHKQLKQRGIDLVVVPFPVKPQIYPEKLAPSYNPSLGPPTNVHEREFIDSLEREGVRVINLRLPLWNAKSDGEQLYMSLDTHWTPAGMDFAARSLAAELVRLHPWLAENTRSFDTRDVPVSNKGDIFDMLKLPEFSHRYHENTVTVRQVFDPQSGELLEPDPDSPVVLLGDSFVNVFSVAAMKWGDHAGFGEHLALHLGRTLDVIAVNGGAPSVTRRRLARSRDLSSKKLVVWGFVTRELIDPESEWELVQFPSAVAAQSQEPFEITGRIIAVSRPPNPGDVPYPHCLTYTKYKVVSVEKGSFGEADLITVQWVMRDFKLLPAADYQVGDIHRMVLVPAAGKMQKDLKQIGETDDIGDLRQPYWVEEMKE